MSCLSGQRILDFMPRLMMACGREVVTYEVQRTGGWKDGKDGKGEGGLDGRFSISMKSFGAIACYRFISTHYSSP